MKHDDIHPINTLMSQYLSIGATGDDPGAHAGDCLRFQRELAPGFTLFGKIGSSSNVSCDQYAAFSLDESQSPPASERARTDAGS